MTSLFAFSVSALAVLATFGISFGCLKRAWLDEVRQELYRMREQVYDRAIAGDLNIDDPIVRGFIQYLHGAIFAMENWSVIEMIRRVASLPEDALPPRWLGDERLKTEVGQAMKTTFHGLTLCSTYSFIFVALGAPVVRMAHIQHRVWESIKVRVSLLFGPDNHGAILHS